MKNNKKCPNCGSDKYKETITKEICVACGLVCDYWGLGPNQVYKDMMDRMYLEEEERQRLINDSAE